jgi:tetratricopeptide (TPR) repeat protein
MNLKKLMQEALDFWQAKNFVQAEKILQKIIKKDKKNSDAHANLGAIYATTKQFELSEIHLKLALRNNNSIGLKANLINVLFEQKKYIDAEILVNQLVEHDPQNKHLLMTKAKIIRNTGKLNEALNILEKLHEGNKDDKFIGVSFAYTLNLTKQYITAVKIYESILKIDEHFFPAIYNCGLIYLNQRIDIKKAIILLEKSLVIQSNNIELLLSLAAAYEEVYRFKDAISLIEKAMLINPKDPRVYYQLGCLHTHSNNLDLSMKNLNYCLKLKPNYIMANYVKSNLLLKEGDFYNGFDLYRYRIYNESVNTRVDDTGINELSNQDNLLIFYEQGIGDIILYSRFFDEIVKRVKKVTIIIPKKLRDFLSFNFQDIEFLIENEFVSEKYIDYKQINLATVPRLLENIDNIISSPKLLKSNVFDNKLLTKSKAQKEKLCGIAWKSNNAKVGDHKSIVLDDFVKNIFRDTEYKLINLQYGDVEGEISKQQKPIEITNVDLFDDISSTAALINLCDVVVTISNVTAHIAGSMGKKTLLLVPRYLGKFWYWEKNLNIYKNIEIFNQDEDGGWTLAMKNLKDCLKKL